ncbi:NAD(P)H-hydrate dehydratase [Ruficoccus amylovorans]|uniref:ADP-dependent (S)-NAD(P)H-hydrate dehydratase n=1 Tax=Ruficoccus amylovorans TaxID=1804625 RepID=A0A842HBZ6_9BACT|nr:NAD(P)H-hydrate dehydratase [Ruficoccus amylovorans]MBC2593137.1 NAD(P)H-hydrate dehydratase [Ruficoccus amylovorans]
MPIAHPILSTDESLDFERTLLPGREQQWTAMNNAGRAVGRAVLQDFGELAEVPSRLRVLALVGKGHNGGDALLAADEILKRHSGAEVHLLLRADKKELRSLTRRAFDELLKSSRASLCNELTYRQEAYDIALDGLLGMQFRPPLKSDLADLLAEVNARRGIRFRAAVDLPSGLGDADAFQADFTYATGIAKSPLFDPAHADKCGRIRYLDIGFFQLPYEGPRSFAENILPDAALQSQGGLRPPRCDKRTFGHLFVLSGSRSFPGALLMSVKAALSSGVGLLTAFAPESLAAQYAAAVPEAMWVPWPETPEGGLALEGWHLLRERLSRADAVLCGSGIGREPETLQLVRDLVREVELPLVIDADALQPETALAAASRPASAGGVVLTPHMGEFMRLAGRQSAEYSREALVDFCQKHRVVTALKGPHTRVCDGSQVALSTRGGPVLARGGSGDMLAGLMGGLVAQQPRAPFEPACRAVLWHGLAADHLARTRGQIAVHTTELLEHFGPALREA